MRKLNIEDRAEYLDTLYTFEDQLMRGHISDNQFDDSVANLKRAYNTKI